MRRRLLFAAAVAIPVLLVATMRLNAQSGRNPECNPGSLIKAVSNTFAYDREGHVWPPDTGYATEDQAVQAEVDRSVSQYDDVQKNGDQHEVRKQGKVVAAFHVVKFDNGRYAVEGGTICAEHAKPHVRSQPPR